MVGKCRRGLSSESVECVGCIVSGSAVTSTVRSCVGSLSYAAVCPSDSHPERAVGCNCHVALSDVRCVLSGLCLILRRRPRGTRDCVSCHGAVVGEVVSVRRGGLSFREEGPMQCCDGRPEGHAEDTGEIGRSGSIFANGPVSIDANVTGTVGPGGRAVTRHGTGLLNNGTIDFTFGNLGVDRRGRWALS